MKLTFNRPFKSIREFSAIELPNFVVLTGVNGAGKSQLLEAIENGAISVEGVPPNQVNGPKPLRRFDWNNLIPQDTGAFSFSQISSEQSGLWNEISRLRQQPLEQLQNQVRRLGVAPLMVLSAKQLASIGADDLLDMGVPLKDAQHVVKQLRDLLAAFDQQIKNQFVSSDPTNRPRLVGTLGGLTDFPLVTMDEDDFYSSFPRVWQPADIFQQSFARLFSAYHRLWVQNKLKEAGRAEGETLEVLSEIAFVDKHGQPPWVFVNRILEVAELDFRINQPYKWDDRPYEPILTDIVRGTQVRFNDLSSGERVLMSFALCVYHASDRDSAADFPRVLLLDEVDAPLHPSMTKSLLRTIQVTLVEQLGISVMLTTHSPSTVALAPEESLHVMRKSEIDRICRTTKDRALAVLTAGVPTLSVNYENRRQVFVESKYDVQYYSSLYEICRTKLAPEISLMFIAAGADGNGNCSQVQSIVGQLTDGGNRTVFGVIDWDLCNADSGTTIVLGKDERYSIENFLLDPVLVGLLLIREKFVGPEEFGLRKDLRDFDVRSLGANDLQRIADTVVSRIEGPKPAQKTIAFEYVSHQSVQVASSFAHLQGHELERRLKEAFPPLRRYHQEPSLKMAIIELVLDDFPEFIPSSVLSVFRRIQTMQHGVRTS